MALGHLIRSWRDHLGLSQAAFAELISEQIAADAISRGLNPPSPRDKSGVSHWEANRASPHQDTLELIAKAIGRRLGSPMTMADFWRGPVGDSEAA